MSSEARHLCGRDAKSNAARTLRLHDAARLCSVRMVRVAERLSEHRLARRVGRLLFLESLITYDIFMALGRNKTEV